MATPVEQWVDECARLMKPAKTVWCDGSQEFDDTLPTGEGSLEAGLSIEPERLAAAMSEWFTKRGKGNGKPVKIELQEINPR